MKLTLVTGTESLLADRAVAHAVAAARHADPEVEVHTVAPGETEPGELAAAASPSVLGGARVVVVRNAHELGGVGGAGVVSLIAAAPDDVDLVVVHSGAANRGKALLEAARRAADEEVSAAPLKKARERVAFVVGEFRRGRRRIDDDAASALTEAVGDDLRELASACSQLLSDTEDTVDLTTVRRYYEGRADVTAFAVADRAVEGRTAEAVELLRHAFASGVAPVVVTSALAGQLRSLVLVASAPRGLSSAEVARHAGLPPWKVDVVKRQLRGWDGEGVAAAIRAVAAADAVVKGAGGDPAYAVERLVVQVSSGRTA
jgi:DNA polymerase-3 subunit delta